MSIDMIRKILTDAKDTPLREIIPSTMGEPLVYKHFEEIISLCHEHHVKLNLTTNGTFPGKGVTEWAKLIVPITSDVKISWNGATKETQEAIMLGSKWEKVISNLETFISIRDAYAANGGNYCQVTLQLTFIEQNVHELADIVKLGIDYGVDRIKGHHLWAHFKEIENLSMRRDKDAIARWNKSVQEAYAIRDKYTLKSGKRIKLENIYPLTSDAHENLLAEGVCPFLGKEAWIATDGRFSPCCAPDILRRQLGEFGSIANSSLTDIWNNPEYQNLQKNYLEHKLCQQCNMRKSPDEVSS